MRYTTILVLFVLLTACNNSDNKSTKFDREIALKKYLLAIENIPFYDTSDINFKVLKAYQCNDSLFFSNIENEQKYENSYEAKLKIKSSCIHLKNLKDLNCDKAYRFTYYAPFCSKPIVATITKKQDSINLHFLVYQLKHDTTPCMIITEFNKRLTSDNWDTFYNKLENADIWGLKRENGRSGVDGSTLTFMAYENDANERNNPRHCYIDRWVYSSLDETFVYVLKISGNRKGCYWMQ